jgi:dipeptidyl aminopeptidase/acylaminoacyl peptidase
LFDSAPLTKTSTILTLLLLLVAQAYSQEGKKPLDKTVYDSWKSQSNHLISRDGKWVSVEFNPQKGDNWLYLHNPAKAFADSLHRGTGAKISHNSNYMAFRIEPFHDTIRKMKLAKKKDEDMPKDSLGIWLLEKNSVLKIPRVKSFTVPKKTSDWMVYKLEKEVTPKAPVDEGKKKKKRCFGKKKGKTETPRWKSNGTELVVLNPINSKQHAFKNVDSYSISENGKLVCFTQAFKGDSLDSTYVHLFHTETEKHQIIHQTLGESTGISLDKKGTQVAFSFSNDTAKNKIYSLYYWDATAEKAKQLVSTSTTGMPENWSVSVNGHTRFSKDGSMLFMGIAENPEPEIKDTLLDSEKYKVDVWNWLDERLQPQQLKGLSQEETETYDAVYHLKEGRFVQLATKRVDEIMYVSNKNGLTALGNASSPYYKLMSWENWYRDVYIIDVETGEKEKVLEKQAYDAQLSPGGNYMAYFSSKDSAWYLYSVREKTHTCLTCDLDVNFYYEWNDIPTDPESYGIAGWGTDDYSLLIYDHYDIWEFDPRGQRQPYNLTSAYGRKNTLQLRYKKLDNEALFIPFGKPMVLTGYNETTKGHGYYQITGKRDKNNPKILLEEKAKYRDLFKAQNADNIVYRRMTFTEYPELYYSDLGFSSSRKLTVTNPQQKDYLWGSVEKVSWTAFNGIKLDGLLYKPEGLDSRQSYPMIIYYYERASERLYNYYSPRPSASTINISFYVSNGYVVFVPDIVYGTGHPGKDAYNSIVSGTKYLLKNYPYIDKRRMGLQGQSWGGYQTAYLVTKTNLYSAAMAGAPVSNMTSAYGGIRWGSGMSRMFQYERTQSRLGVTLWENPDLYLENSPVFHVDSCNTPLLIMHNDNDGAVPWYQGIEMFVAMRRLNKPVWMLNYNGDGHNLMRTANRKDLSIRMKQFFDHYLQGTKAPVWMEKGIPAIEKGKNNGYDLIDND